MNKQEPTYAHVVTLEYIFDKFISHNKLAKRHQERKLKQN